LLSDCLVPDNKLKHPELALRTPVLHISLSTVVLLLPHDKTVLAVSQTRKKIACRKINIREIRMELL
jgi:hypothetical protein